jgi:hypothetical protein
MQGEELPGVDGQGPEWFIPVVVSHAREVTDKGTFLIVFPELELMYIQSWQTVRRV